MLVTVYKIEFTSLKTLIPFTLLTYMPAYFRHYKSKSYAIRYTLYIKIISHRCQKKDLYKVTFFEDFLKTWSEVWLASKGGDLIAVPLIGTCDSYSSSR